jgi:protein-L-isoaspartate(D-aspartate) O-methyltransferase
MTRLPDGTPITQSTDPEVMTRMHVGLRAGLGMKVLEVGTGSGYNAVLLIELVGGAGRVVTVEVSEAVSAAAQERLMDNGYVRVVCMVGDGWHGCEEHAPYDRIIAATKPERAPDAWVDLLKPGGILVTPVDRPESPTGTVIAYFRKGRRL